MLVTVTLQVAVFSPSSVFTVIVAVPDFTAFTTPLVSTVATVSSLLDQLTFLLVASSGLTVAVNVTDSLTFNISSLWDKETSVTFTTTGATVTLQVAVFSPSSVFTVIVAVPAFSAFTSPLVSTVATVSSLLDQLTALCSLRYQAKL